MAQSKKLSIIIPVYNTEKLLKRCLDRLLEQTYKNIEIIVVNDASTDNSKTIIKDYQKKDNRIIYLEHTENKGLFCTRIDGFKKSTGEYVAFLDSDDYVSIDFYRTLMVNIQENDSDIAMGKTIIEDSNGNKNIINLFDCKHHFVLKDQEIFDKLLKQKGLSYDWQTVWNKVYKREIWNKALSYYDGIKEHHVMTEDICFSVVLFYFAKKLTFTQNDGIFYCQNGSSITNNKNGGYKKIKKNIEDVRRTFNFMENFLKKVELYDKYEEEYLEWRALYKDIWNKEVDKYQLSIEEREKIEKLLNNYYSGNAQIEQNAIYNMQTQWNDGLEKIKLAICDENIKYVSFDMFDTLVQRPFMYPTDLFEVLNKYFLQIYNNKIGINFKKIRVYCESLTREKISKKYKDYQDITIDEIYETIENTYHIDKNVLEKIKNKEKELEIRFCNKRKTGYELYSLALALGKKVIITSDMYLDKITIEKILNKNGYNEITKIFLSSEIRLTKVQGDLYSYILEKEEMDAKFFIHIGDNYYSDVEMASKYGIKALHLIKALDIAISKEHVNNLLGMFLNNIPSWKDNVSAKQFLGIRSMIAVFVNEYFDNPYVTFNTYTDFNSDPYLIGYYALGFYMYGVTKWLLDDTQKEGYDNIVFMARDGYLPMETYKIMKKLYKNVPNEEYLYVSRKSLIPVIIRDEMDFYKLSEFVNVCVSTPNEILKYLKDCIKVDEKKFEKLCKENSIEPNKQLDNIANFNNFIKIIIDNFLDKKLLDSNQKKLKEYFLSKYKGKSATFDVGYSARPELYLSQLCNKPLDTYFLNINEDIAYMHSNIGGFKLKTFFNGKPAITGFLYEAIVSALAPSCIGYDFKLEHITPIFEKYNKTFQEEFFIGIMQKSAIKFVQDIVDIFDNDIDLLFYENYYITLPIMAYINSSRHLDRFMLDSIFFEDDIGIKERKSLNFLIEREAGWKNQVELHNLIDIRYRLYDAYTMYQPNVYLTDLNNRNKIIKMFYYLNFNRPIFKRRMKEIFGKTHVIYPIGKFGYRGIKKCRNITYRIIHKNK